MFVQSVIVNSLLIAPFIGRVVSRHIGWSKQQHQLVKSKKLVCEELRQSIKNLEIFLDSLRGYYCEPSQRTANRLILLM
jgi:hypothetical protein